MSRAKDMAAQAWEMRITAAEKRYIEWSTKYNCVGLEKLYLGKHYSSYGDYEPYVLNLVYATIKLKLSNYILHHPEFRLSPRAGRVDFNPDVAMRASVLKESALNEVINRPDAHFVDETEAVALDSYFRFGIMETGYAADWQHPDKPEPLTSAHENPEVEVDKANKKDSIDVENEIPENERIYFKHIPAKRFRVSSISSRYLNQSLWCGYYTYIPKLTLLKTPGIKIPDDYDSYFYGDAGTQYLDDYSQMEQSEFSGLLNSDRICKVWYIWDNVDKTRKLLLDGTFQNIWSKPFERINLQVLTWDKNTEQDFYPIPPAFQWRLPQQEINESREQMRAYRSRYIRRYGYQKGTVTPDELNKFVAAQDGEVIEFKSMPNGMSPIQPIPNAELGATIEAGLVVGKDDFNIVAANSSELRGASDRETATAAKISAIKEEARESVEQLKFNRFLTDVGREALLQMSENFSRGVWVSLSADPVLPNIDPNNYDPNAIQELEYNKPIFEFITANEIDDGNDFNLELNIVNATPAQTSEDLQKLITFFSLVQQIPQVAMSPILIREVAYKSGYRNERIIAEMQKNAVLNLMSQVQGAQAQAGEGAGGFNSGNNAAKSQVANANPTDSNQIVQQMTAQLGL